MNDSHLKRVAILIVCVIAVLVAGSLYLFAKPSAPVPPVPNPQQSKSTTSTQPKITWSPNQLQVILAPTESASSDLTFSGSLNLQNALIEAVPEIAGFLTVQPNSFANASAGSPNAVHISFSIPSSTALGTYTGTIHVRIGSSTVPQTLKVIVNVWQGAELTSASATIAIPPGWLIQTTSTQIGASSPALQSLVSSQDAEVPPQDLLVRILPKAAFDPIGQFASSLDNGSLASYATKSVTTVDGHAAVVYSDVQASVPHQPVLVAVIDDPAHNQAILITLQQIASGDLQTLFAQLLSAMQFH